MHEVTIPKIGSASAWRQSARALLQSGTRPENVLWNLSSAQPDLFSSATDTIASNQIRVPRSFLSLANTVCWHSDPQRFARLYGLLWRLRREPHLMSDRGDQDLSHLRRMEKAVRRCQHKMKAFVRFREIGAPSDARRSFAAWFEPTHHTIEPTAEFFANRFGDMDWRILSPDVSAICVGGKLSFEDGCERPDLPEDASKELWLTYFQNIFNPARLKVQAMQSEMPKKYWKNMPEGSVIQTMIDNAQTRSEEMALNAPTKPPRRAGRMKAQADEFDTAWSGSSDALAAALQSCTLCPLHAHATQAVPGEGPTNASLMIVGKQPGDTEDLVGRPLVGPGGKVFDEVAQSIGLDRRSVYITNATKHFKFRPQNRRRIALAPSSEEIVSCVHWLDAEIALVRPQLILALGAAAAEALTGCGKNIMERRGKIEHGRSGQNVLITVHPAYVLRLPDAPDQVRAKDILRHDLKLAKMLTSELTDGTRRQ